MLVLILNFLPPRLTRSASTLRGVGEGFLAVRFSDLRLSTQRFFVSDTGLPVFSSCSVGLGVGVSTRKCVRICLAVAVSLPKTKLNIRCVFCRAGI
jgi:hypothetical protein